MSAGKQYLLDANVFIAAHKQYYGFDICPGFWAALSSLNEAKRIFSIDKIKTELLATSDRLSAWVKNKAPKTFFKATADKAVLDAFREMANWVQRQTQFTPEAKAEFAAVADGWVIAYAKANGHVVVTHEEYRADAKTRVLIPNVCLEFDVDYCNTFTMLRELNVHFTLGKQKAT